MAKSFGDKFWDEIEKNNKKNKIDDPFEIGKVISEDPLTIEIEGLPLYEDNLNVNPYLLSWDEVAFITSSTNNEQVSIHHDSKLKFGVSVACYGIEYNEVGKTYQRYVVLEVIE